MQKLPVVACLVAGTLLSSCNPAKHITEAQKAVEEFHRHYDAGTPDLIYRKADAGMKAANSEQEVVAFINGVHAKLGSIKSTSMHQSNFFTGPNGSEVRLVYKTVYEKGTGTEKFTYMIHGGKPSLLSWFIDSPQLTSRPGK